MTNQIDNVSSKGILILIAVGVWINVIQSFKTQTVIIKEGTIDLESPINVRGSVSVDNTVDISGSVDISNTVDVNLYKINNKRNVFYDFGGNGDYCRIPVMTTNPSEY